jgi:ureidoglycolate hydrolase
LQGRALSAGLALGLFLLASACQNQAGAAEHSERTPVAVEAPAAAAAAARTHAEAAFMLEMKPLGPYAAGRQGEAEIVLTAKAPYKTNEGYPYRFTARPTQGVKHAAEVTRDKLVLEKERARMTIAFTPESSGTKKVLGQFAFSVCTDERCLIEKRDLELEFVVE